MAELIPPLLLSFASVEAMGYVISFAVSYTHMRAHTHARTYTRKQIFQLIWRFEY